MIIDNIKLIDGSIQNAVIESGTELPTTELVVGRIFFLKQSQGASSVGLHIYSGLDWVLFSSSQYVDDRISSIVGTAPETLNSLSELADALGDDPEFILTINNKINTESSRAASAESAVVSSLDEETRRAMAIESNLRDDLNSEISTRTLSDTTLEDLIATESAARSAADTSFQNQIDSGIVDRDNQADTKLNLSGGTMTGYINLHNTPSSPNHPSTKSYSDALKTASDDALDSERERAIAAEDSIDADLSTEVARATGVEAILASNITDEVTRAQSVEGSLQRNIDTETQARLASDSALQAAITTEHDRSVTAEDALQDQIDGISGTGGTSDVERSQRIAADNDLQDSVDANATAIATEASARNASDTTLQQGIDAAELSVIEEHDERVAADGVLQDNIDDLSTALTAEASTRSSAVAGVQAQVTTNASDIASEESARIAAVNALQSQVTTIDNTDFLRSDVDDTMTGLLTLTKTPTSANHATHKKYVDDKINELIDAAPGALDTLNELAAALGDDPNFATTVTNNITAEEAARIAADSDLQDGVDANASAIATEAATRLSKDNALRSDVDDNADAITAEASARSSADSAIQTQVTAIKNTNFLRGDINDTMAGFLTLTKTPTNNSHAANKSYVDAKINEIVSAAPGTLDTLNELAAALGDDPNFATTITDTIAAEEAARIASDNALSDRIDGAGSSTASETSARIAGDNALGGRIDDVEDDVVAEASARSSADSAIQSQVTTIKNTNFLRGDINDTMAGFLTLTKTPTSNAHAANKSYVDAKINEVVNAAPGTLDTLNELAAALGDDPNFATTITNNIAAEEAARVAADSSLQTSVNAKLAKSGGVMTGNVEFNADGGGVEWSRNSDFASILFMNDADSDTNSRLEFTIGDNSNEFYRWVAKTSGTATPTELMKLTPGDATNGLTFRGHKVYHAGNDGAGSGLDADKLDNLTSSQFLRSDTNDTMTGFLSLSKTPTSNAHAANKSYVDSAIGGVEDSRLFRKTFTASSDATISTVYSAANSTLVMFADTTSSAIKITLPTNPATGCVVTFVDVAGKFGTNALTIGRGGSLIMGFTDDMEVSQNFASVTLIYSGGTNGWRLVY